MHEWGTRMLPGHYLDDTRTKAELSRRFGGEHRRPAFTTGSTQGSWIATWLDWPGALLATTVRREPAGRLQGDHRSAAAGVPEAVGAAIVRRG